MAADERDDQVPEAAAVDAGRAAPALRKQQGRSRQVLGSYGKDVDAERLVQLRKENHEFRQGCEKERERQRKKNEDMAEAYKKRQEDMKTKAKEERQNRLLRLEGQKERSVMRSQERSLFSSVQLSVQESEIMDDEYRMLLEKYGDKVRVPRIPPVAWMQSSIMSSESSRSHKSLSRRRERLDTGVVRRPAPKPEPAAAKKAPAKASNAPVSSGGSATLPALKTAGTARPNAPAAGNEVAADAVEGEVPEPERSLMPRKDALRKFQQSLIKKTDVSFYKSHMKKHFRRILESAELTFSDTNGRREQAGWNLAKPLSIAELKQLSSVVVR